MRSSDPSKGQLRRLPAGSRSLGVAAIDPVPIYCDGLSSVVHRTSGMHWCGHALSHHAALQLCEQLRPDIVLIDSGTDPNGHLTKLLCASDPALVVVALVREANRTARYLSVAIAAGTHGLVPRRTEPRRLAEAIHRAHTERRYLDPTLAALAVRPRRQGAPLPRSDGSPTGPRMPLSRREYEVLQLVAEGLENSAIAKSLFLSVETVRTHVKSILRKLSARDRTHAVTIAFRGGILVVPADDSALPDQEAAVVSPRQR